MKAVRTLGAALLLASTAAHGLSGNELLKLCERKESAACLGYIRGATDGIQYGAAYAQVKAARPDIPYCFADGTDLRQFRDVILKYLVDNPQQRHLPAQLHVLEAMSRAFPCPK